MSKVRIKNLVLIIICFLYISNISLARRTKVISDLYWELEYSLNKYGEEDKIIGAYCGQYGLSTKVSIDKNGIIISKRCDYIETKIDGMPVKISFLFDSKDEIIIEDAKKIKIDSGVYTKGYFISKFNPNFKKLFNKIKLANYMSILIEEKNGLSDKIVKVDNRYSNKILSKLDELLFENEENQVFFENIINEAIYEGVFKDFIESIKILKTTKNSIEINAVIGQKWYSLSKDKKQQLAEQLAPTFKELAVNTYQVKDKVMASVIFINSTGEEVASPNMFGGYDIKE